jgi:hypothetical protein
LFSTAPCTPMVLLTDPSTSNTGVPHSSLVPSISGETNDKTISISDGSVPPNYMYSLTVGGAGNVFSGHIDPTFCGGTPCFVTDVTSLSSAWPGSGFLAFSRNPANNPGPNKHLIYKLNLSSSCAVSGSPDCSIAPVLQSLVLTYSAGAVTAAAPTNIYATNTCPNYGHLFVGDGLAVGSALFIDNLDDHLYFILGGAQDTAQRHMAFSISLSTGKCENWDTQGTTGTALAAISNGTAQGTGYAPGDTGSFTEAAGVCPSTYSVTTVGGTGNVTKAAIATGATSGCYLGRGFATTAPSGAGSGFTVDVTAIGTPGTTETIYRPIASASCPAGINTTLTCESPTATSVPVANIHSGSMLSNGLYAQASLGPPTVQLCAGCDFTTWTLGSSSALTQSTAALQNGHNGVGYNFEGTASNPNYYVNKLVSAYADPTCANPIDCQLLYTLPSGGAGGNCAVSPGGAQLHSAAPSPLNDDSFPIYITSSINTPGTPVQTNPPGFTCALSQQSLFTVTRAGVPRWLNHWYENGNNFVTPPEENFEAADNIGAVSPDGVIWIGATDMNKGFAGNVGLGSDNLGAAFAGVVAVLVTSSGPSPLAPLAPSAPSFANAGQGPLPILAPILNSAGNMQ